MNIKLYVEGAVRKSDFSKGKVSFQLLEVISPAKVEAASPHAKALFDRLRNL